MEESESQITQELIDRGHARRLDYLESYFAAMHRQKLYRNFNVYGELNKPVTKGLLTVALRSLFFKYPILCQTIIPRQFPDHESYYCSEEYLTQPLGEREYAKVLPKVNLSDILLNLQPEYEDNLKEISEQFIKDEYRYTSDVIELVGAIRFPFYDKDKPNWGLICLPARGEEAMEAWTQLVYVSDHCFSDATSGVNFLQDLAKELSFSPEVVEHKDPFVIIDYEKDYLKISKVAPSLAQYIDYKPNWTALPRFICSSLTREYLIYKASGEKTSTVDKTKMQTYHNLLKFDPEKMKKIKTEIKAKVHAKCTITPFLQACWLIALYGSGKVLTKRWTEWGFDVAVPKNTRTLLPKDEELRDRYKYGSSVGALHYSYLISSFNIKYNEEQKFWSLVEYYNATYLKYPEDYLVGIGILMTDFVTKHNNYDKLLCDSFLNKQPGGLLLSNAGYNPQDSSQPYHLKDLIFSQTPGALTFTFGMNVCSTNSGGMNVDLSVVRTAIKDRDEWGFLCQEFKNVVANFTSVSPN